MKPTGKLMEQILDEERRRREQAARRKPGCGWCGRALAGEPYTEHEDGSWWCSSACRQAWHSANNARIEFAPTPGGGREWHLAWKCERCGFDRYVRPHQADEIDAIDELKQALAHPHDWASHECDVCKRGRLERESREHTSRSDG